MLFDCYLLTFTDIKSQDEQVCKRLQVLYANIVRVFHYYRIIAVFKFKHLFVLEGMMEACKNMLTLLCFCFTILMHAWQANY